MFNVLILCTHNSARSVLAEGMLNQLAARFGKNIKGFSAGSSPSGRINPFALAALSEAGISIQGLRSKSWDEFTTSSAPPIDIVITVCDNAAAEVCPVFYGGSQRPVKAHWGFADPSLVEGDDGKRRAFDLTRQAIAYRMLQLVLLPLDSMDSDALNLALQNIAAS